MWQFSKFASATLFNVDILQGLMINQDILESQFNLVNDGVIILNTTSTVTKVNKSAEIMFNITSQNSIGKQITELIS